MVIVNTLFEKITFIHNFFERAPVLLFLIFFLSLKKPPDNFIKFIVSLTDLFFIFLARRLADALQ